MRWFSVSCALLLTHNSHSCEPFFVIRDLGSHDASATASAISLSLDEVPFGFPHTGHHCDELAAVASDGSVRGIALNTTQGYSLGMLGTVGERIYFKYKEFATGALRVSSYVFFMSDDVSISTYSSPLTLPFSTAHDPCNFACAYYSIQGFVLAVPANRHCYLDGGLCRINGQDSVFQCYVDSEALVPCYVPFPPPLPAPPLSSPAPSSPPSPFPPPPHPLFPPAVPLNAPQMPPPPPSPPKTEPETPPPLPPPPLGSPSPPPQVTSSDDTFPVAGVVIAVICSIALVSFAARSYTRSLEKTSDNRELDSIEDDDSELLEGGSGEK